MAPGHPREGGEEVGEEGGVEWGGRSGDKYLKWAFFHRSYVTWQTHLLCDEARSDRVRGGLSGSGQASRSAPHPPPQLREEEVVGKTNTAELQTAPVLDIPGDFHLIPSFQSPCPPSVPALTWTPRGTSSLTPPRKRTQSKIIHENIGRSRRLEGEEKYKNTGWFL